jgi:hypothetical protein
VSRRARDLKRSVVRCGWGRQGHARKNSGRGASNGTAATSGRHHRRAPPSTGASSFGTASTRFPPRSTAPSSARPHAPRFTALVRVTAAVYESSNIFQHCSTVEQLYCIWGRVYGGRRGGGGGAVRAGGKKLKE